MADNTATSHEHTGRAHLILRGGTVIDGSGAAPRRADVAVEGARIAAVGELSGWRADEEVDVAGCAVAPGFIDVHTHDDRAVLETPDMAFKVSQGVATVIAGNCGISLAPFRPVDSLPEPTALLRGPDDFFPRVGDSTIPILVRPRPTRWSRSRSRSPAPRTRFTSPTSATKATR